MRGTSLKPRLSVFRSHNHIYVQLIDDSTGRTLASASSYHIKGKERKSDLAKKVGEAIAEKAKELGIRKAVFDRGGYRFHGRIRQVYEGAKSKGLNF